MVFFVCRSSPNHIPPPSLGKLKPCLFRTRPYLTKTKTKWSIIDVADSKKQLEQMATQMPPARRRPTPTPGAADSGFLHITPFCFRSRFFFVCDFVFVFICSAATANSRFSLLFRLFVFTIPYSIIFMFSRHHRHLLHPCHHLSLHRRQLLRKNKKDYLCLFKKMLTLVRK